ncbi:MAG: glycoside hydrolase family 38 C-terminal domain-containing protein [Ignavibacteriaceae bacterium]
MNKKYHVISNTHWDREWRYSYQRNRQMLVEMIDDVLDILEKNPDYRAFHLDSQSIVLDDYLEIRKEKLEIIKKFVEEKRLLIGPWYILPDEFLVGGENLIRNLLLGHKTCKPFGRVSKIGYSPFSWGQISQLPQIYNGFGVDLIMFYRGVNSLDSKHAEFIWEGADGTKALSSRFSTMPRYNFYFYIYRTVIHDEDPFLIEYKWSRGGTPFHFSSFPLENEDYFIINPADTYYEENIVPWVKKLTELQDDDFTTENVIWMEGHDSSGPNAKTARIINDIKRLIPGINVVHSTLEDYQEELRKTAEPDKLALVKGERRSAQYDRRSGNLYGHVISSRTYLKMENFNSERWLQHYAEPFNSLAGIFGMNIKDGYLNIAWNYLIQNSAHDSIGGCSRDSIHEDMMWRYKQINEISEGVFSRGLKYLVLQTNTAPLKNKHDLYLTAVNPNFQKRDATEFAVIDIPAEYDKGSFSVVDENGKEVPLQILTSDSERPVLEQLIDRPMYFEMIRYRALLLFRDLPAFGLKTYKIVPKKKFSKVKLNSKTEISSKKLTLENEFYKIKINQNGTFDVTDKINGNKFSKLGYFFDEGEEGNAWTHKPLDPVITTLDSKPEIGIYSSGDLSGSFLISHKIKLPEDRSTSAKKSDRVKHRVDLIIELVANSPCINLFISFDNKVRNHRLRIMFPAKLDAKFSYAEGGFDVVSRSTERADTKEWVEQPQYDFPFNHFVNVENDNHGLALFGNGLKEYEVLDDKAGTLAITLLKAFSYKIAPSSEQDYSYEEGSQAPGPIDFEIGLFLHSRESKSAVTGSENIFSEALNFHNHIQLIQHGKTEGTLPPANSFISLSTGDTKISCLKQSEDGGGFVLRLFNPTEKTVDEEIFFNIPVKRISEVTLEETDEKELKMSDHKLALSIGSRKITTLKIFV